jgi:hypothetical protein
MSLGSSRVKSGFNETQINTSLTNLQNAYNDLYYALCQQMQTQFVDDVATFWACTEAQVFFNKVATTLNDMLHAITNTYGVVTSTITAAAVNWAQNTGSGYTSVPFNPKSQRVNSDSIQENIGGKRGADTSKLNQVISTVKQINAMADSALDQSVQAVSNSGFSDAQDSQQQALEGSLRAIKQKIDATLAAMVNDFSREINNTVANYGAIVSKNASDLGAIG